VFGDKNNSVDKNNPIVALEPEDPLNQGSYIEKSKRMNSLSKHSGEEGKEGKGEGELGMSLYMQEKLYLKQLE
jgi:hypothetical protein